MLFGVGLITTAYGWEGAVGSLPCFLGGDDRVIINDEMSGVDKRG
jgi:hypothetical protein